MRGRVDRPPAGERVIRTVRAIATSAPAVTSVVLTSGRLQSQDLPRDHNRNPPSRDITKQLRTRRKRPRPDERFRPQWAGLAPAVGSAAVATSINSTAVCVKHTAKRSVLHLDAAPHGRLQARAMFPHCRSGLRSSSEATAWIPL